MFAEDVLQHCSSLTKDVFAIFSDSRKKTDLIWNFLRIFQMFKTWLKLKYVNGYIGVTAAIAITKKLVSFVLTVKSFQSPPLSYKHDNQFNARTF